MKGAFTGATGDKPGRFASAEGGTIFLDEINSAPPSMQVKLLRILQEKLYEPVGSSTPREADVRVVLATNTDLGEMVRSGGFRQDLFYRINVVGVDLPPLRDRPADVPLLAEHFLGHFRDELKRQVVGFTPEASAAMQRYGWPGNIRELENAVERATVALPAARASTSTTSPRPSPRRRRWQAGDVERADVERRAAALVPHLPTNAAEDRA